MLTCNSVLRASAIAVGVLICAHPAWISSSSASPYSILPSAGEPGDPADLNVHVDYEYSVHSSVIYRESVGGDIDPLSPLPRERDMQFQQFRHLIKPRAELSIFYNTWVSFAIPIVLTQVRELELADGVTRETSSTVRDGILPFEGFDAEDPGTAPPGNFLFRGVKRKGIDQIHLGLGIAPMAQEKDDTKPTWKIGGELLLAAGKVARFDRFDPADQDGVGRGVNELRFWTSVAKRAGRVEGYYQMFWQVPISAKEASQYDEYGFGATNLMPGQQAGATAGLELVALDDKLTETKIGLDLGLRVVGHFEGREYSELWEVFAYAGDSRASGPLQLDNDPITAGLQAQSHPGITNHENYLETAGRIAIAANLGPTVQFSAVADLAWKTDHLITFTDAGVDLPTCATGETPCEEDDNFVVNPGTREVNPLHVQKIDLVGHRYISEDNFAFSLGVEARLLF